MLEFFRKYQRYFFIFVTVIIIVTFSLFGSYKTFGQGDGRKEIIVGRAIDGSKLKYFEIKQLSAMLGAENGQTGVIGNEFLKTGVAGHLAAAFFEPLKADWQARLERAKRCRFYVHPAAPALNAQEIWNQLSPGAIEELHTLQGMHEPNADFFAVWTRLFWLQEKCPGELIKRIIFYHQNQYQLPPDQHLYNEDCSLLGFQGTGEWFGPTFIDLASQFILNGAIAAEEKGFHATKTEAEADLIKRFSSKEHNLETALRAMGLQKSDAVHLWQRVLLFVRYFQTVGQATLIDDLAYRQFSDFANETARIDLYELPKELQLKSENDFLCFEVYKRLACAPCDMLFCPKALLRADEVLSKAPELVYAKYHLKNAQIDIKTIESRLSMREVWSWQIEPSHWDALKKTFPEIKDLPGKNPFQVLEKLDAMRRAAIDDWTRQQIVESHPEWIEQELSAAPVQESDLLIFANGDIDGLPIDQVADFQALLDRAASGDQAALDSLKAYRENSSIWRISDVSHDPKLTVISFADAKKKERIKTENFLEEEYILLREQSPSLYQNENGDYQPFSKVKETLILQTFAPLFRALDRECLVHDQPLAYYIQHRFDPWMRQALLSLQSGKDLSEQNGLWSIEKCERSISRTSSEEWIMKEPFALKPDQWSDLNVSDGEIAFFFLQERSVVPTPVFEQIQQGKQVLAGDIKCLLAQQLIELALKKQAIVIPLAIEQEKNDDI